YKCKVCGHEALRNTNTWTWPKCGVWSQDIVSLYQRYLREKEVWKLAGKPERSQEEIDLIINLYCKPCNRYNAVTGQCGKCGCVLTYKVKMATSQCPEGKWFR